jgi:nucleoside-diphosphate-sugar epimerase
MIDATPVLDDKNTRLQGPILVLGASGFIGANLLQMILRSRGDAYGVATRLPAWRLDALPRENVRATDLLVDSNLDSLLDSVKPRTIFDCVAYGAYSFENDSPLIYRTNFTLATGLLERLRSRKISAYIHAGSSSEYGDNAENSSVCRASISVFIPCMDPWRIPPD